MFCLENKTKLYFIGYFLLAPLFFGISFLSWKGLFLGSDFFDVSLDLLGILGVYYLFTSICFGFVFAKGVKIDKEA